MNFSHLLRQFMVLYHEVRARQIEALMPGLTVDQVKAIRREEGIARQEKRRLARIIRDECRLRVDCWEHGRPYGQVESRLARQGTRHR